MQPSVLEFRVALTVDDYERLTAFYADGLGLEPAQVWANEQGRGTILDLGRATLEIFDEQQAATIDQLEAGERLSGQVRFALQVPNVVAAVERLIACGAILIRPPFITPWRHYNARLKSPDGLQITLFQVLDPE